MLKEIHIKKGLDIKLLGQAVLVSEDVPYQGIYAVCPDNFHSIVPQMLVKPGDRVLAGDALFCSKYDNRLKITSPVSGEVLNIVRGAKRRILRIEIQADNEPEFREFDFNSSISELKADDVKKVLLDSGAWSLIKQRPFDIIASIDSEPKSIFISAYNTMPLGNDYEYSLRNKELELQTAIDALSKLTKGKVYLGVDSAMPSSLFYKLKNVELYSVSGPHPAGNVGVQINNIDPINKGETVFCINPTDLLVIGELFLNKKFNLKRKVAITGSSILKPKYANAYAGAKMSVLTGDNIKNDIDSRYISGSVLTGTDVSKDGFLGYYDNQITLIPDGKEDSRFLGWIAPNTDKLSFLRAGTFSWMSPDKLYELNNNKNGAVRAFVVTGIYEKVFPMDIYPLQLVKAAICEDIEALEELGIYEVAPEDFALCSFICPSKIEHQVIIRKALDLVMNN